MLERVIFYGVATLTMAVLMGASAVIGWVWRDVRDGEQPDVRPEKLYTADGAWWGTPDGRAALGDEMSVGDHERIARALQRSDRRPPSHA